MWQRMSAGVVMPKLYSTRAALVLALLAVCLGGEHPAWKPGSNGCCHRQRCGSIRAAKFCLLLSLHAGRCGRLTRNLLDYERGGLIGQTISQYRRRS
jgi:hypothetical protein